MAIIQTGPLASAISGSIGGLTFVAASGRTGLRRRALRVNRLTEAQINHRANLQLIRNQWADLDDDTRLQWRMAAETLTFPNRLGITRNLTAYQLFIKAALDNPTAFAVLDTDPLTLSTTPPLENLGASLSNSGTFVVNFTSRDVKEYVRVFGSRTCADYPQVSPRSYRFVKGAAANTGTVSFKSEFTAILGLPPQGEVVSLLVSIWSPNHFSSPKTRLINTVAI